MEQRRFSLRHLRDLGFGKTSLESMIQDEIRDLLADITDKTADENVVDFGGLFNLSLINILYALIGGERFARSDARLKHLLGLVEVFIRTGNFLRALVPVPGFLLSIMRKTPVLCGLVGLRNDLFGPLQHFIGVNKKKTYSKIHLLIRCWLQEGIEEHKKDRSDDSPRDFIDVYLKEMEKQDKSSSFHSNFI